MCEGATYGKVVPSRLFYLSSASWRKSLNCFLNFGKLKAGAHSAAAYGKVVPSHPLHKFGKLTQKFELLRQFRKAENRHPSAAAYGKAVPSRLSLLRSVS